ncbi:hypothetical protein ACUHMQ_02340 [Chitinimonas sp. PSY-7]|uniref:hypothetical protein n=1 Tax=Chitinimonas sp. PSY-7 TaxID=3459088 RepID=UPI00404003EC
MLLIATMSDVLTHPSLAALPPADIPGLLPQYLDSPPYRLDEMTGTDGVSAYAGTRRNAP